MDEFERAAHDHEFVTQVLTARDMLRPIITGEIERGHCVGDRECYGARPGMRKTKLADAVKIAKTVEIILNRAVNEFDHYEE
jgi:hypothetical protein